MEAVKSFFIKKDVIFSPKRYFVDAMGSMAKGLFCTLLIGTIINTVADLTHLWFLTTPFVTIAGTSYTVGSMCSFLAGAAMAVAIGFALKAPPLVLFSLTIVGLATNALGGAGGPLAVFFIAIVASECGKLIDGQTKVDILTTPLVTIGVGLLLAFFTAPYIGWAAMQFGSLIMVATNLQPFIMGIIVSVLVGVALTLPISSAAICASLGLVGLAGGAAVAGCCAQMVGFAVMSFTENKVSGLISQGLGTSMLQMGNIVKNPRIWIAPTFVSAITGPLATCVFNFQMNGPAISSGMGTCGLVGPIGVYQGWVSDIEAGIKTGVTFFDILGMALICFIIPAVITPLVNLLLIKIGWVKKGDMTLNRN